MADSSISGLLFSQDPLFQLKNSLRRALPEEVVVCEQSLPDGWNPNHGMAVVVSDDAHQVSETAHDRALVRVNVHSYSFDLSRRVGRSIYEYLLSPINRLSLSISRTRSTRPIVGPDSLAGGYVSTCSYSCGTSRKVVN